MRASPEVQAPSSAVAARTAYVLADAELWSPALESALGGVGLNLAAAAELHQLFEACTGERVALVVLAKRNARFAVKACRAMRGLQGVPILVVIPREGDLVPVLDAGADDAVIARVDPTVFAARVRALLRRVRQETAPRGLVAIRELEIDLDKCQASLSGRPVPLTPTEFRIISVLAQRAGRVIDARALLGAVNNNDYSERDAQSLVKVHIANLRRKLNDSGAQNPYILCVRGFGYMLERRAQRREDDPLADLIDNEEPA